MISQLINDKLIFLNLDVTNRDELFKIISSNLENNHFVSPLYYSSLIKRENSFPTGLDLGEYYVAIPHSDCKNIYKKFVAIVTLNQPLLMKRMDEPQQNIPVDCLFFLGVTNDESQIQLLQEILKIIQNKKIIYKIRTAKNINEVLNILKSN